jgi:hypothetical protein
MLLPHLRVSAIFSYFNSEEIAVCSVNIGQEDGGLAFPGTDAERVAQANDYFADWSAFVTRAASLIPGAVSLTRVKVASIGPLGLYTRDSWESTSPAVAGTNASGGLMPAQTAMVASLMTSRRGPTGRGRMYLPCRSLNIGSDSRIAAADALGLAGSVATLLNALNNEPGLDPAADQQVVVASSKGFNTLVTGVRVGRVPDTVRSRRSQLIEEYQTAATAIA